MEPIIIGVDVGNYATKTRNTEETSGFSDTSIISSITSDYLFYNGKYYIPSNTRFPYSVDKTMSDQCLILTLFGISRELLKRIALKRKRPLSQEELQNTVNQITEIYLGAGLPPKHMALRGEPLKKYYMEKFSTGVSYSYKGISFNFQVRNCMILPQDYAAVISYHPTERNGKKPLSITTKYSRYYAIDIGGGTIDVVPIIGGKPDVITSQSLEKGTNMMSRTIQSKVQEEFNINITQADIEDIIRNKPHVFDSPIVTLVHNEAYKWTLNLFSELRETGLDFQATPCIFLGGGSKLLKKYIERCPLFGKVNEFIGCTRQNAIGYEYFMQKVIS